MYNWNDVRSAGLTKICCEEEIICIEYLFFFIIECDYRYIEPLNRVVISFMHM